MWLGFCSWCIPDCISINLQMEFKDGISYFLNIFFVNIFMLVMQGKQVIRKEMFPLKFCFTRWLKNIAILKRALETYKKSKAYV